MEMLDYIYDHFDEFRLLLSGAHGTHFAHFLDELVDIEVEYTYKYMEVIGCESVKKGVVTEDFIHMIVTAYFNGMFEVVRHGMPKEDAVRYSARRAAHRRRYGPEARHRLEADGARSRARCPSPANSTSRCLRRGRNGEESGAWSRWAAPEPRGQRSDPQDAQRGRVRDRLRPRRGEIIFVVILRVS